MSALLGPSADSSHSGIGQNFPFHRYLPPYLWQPPALPTPTRLPVVSPMAIPGNQWVSFG